MLTDKKYSSVLFWLVVVHLSVISISIAAASTLFGLSLLLLIVWSVVKRKNILPQTSLDYFFLAYIAIHCITTLTSLEPLHALHNAKRLFLFAMMYISVLSFTTKERFYTFLTIVSGIVALQSLIEIFFYFFEHNERLHMFQHYMTTGGLKMILALLLLPFLIDRKEIQKRRMLFALFFLPIFIALILTNTRSSWLGFLAGVILISALHYKNMFAGIALLIIAFFVFAPQSQVERAKSIIDLTHPSNYGRLNMWTTGWKIFQDYPLTGVGDIDLHTLYLQYKTPEDTEYGGHLHNNLVMLLVIHGIVGLGIVLALWWKILREEILLFARNKTSVLKKNIGLGTAAAFTGFFVNGLFEWNFGDHEIMIFIWTSVGLAMAAKQLNEEVSAS